MSFEDPNDRFYPILWDHVGKMVEKRNMMTTNTILHRIDSDFAGSASLLAAQVPGDLD
jgi:hypothetical protein